MKKPREPSPSFYAHMEKFLPPRPELSVRQFIFVPTPYNFIDLELGYDETDDEADVHALGVKRW